MQQTADILHSLVQLAPYIVAIAVTAIFWLAPDRKDDPEQIAETRKQTALLERISAKLEH